MSMVGSTFVGTGHRLAQDDIGQMAAAIDIETAVLLAILEVEAAGKGFDAKNRPKMLPERHIFWRELGDTKVRDDAARVGLAYPKWGSSPYPKTSDACYQMLARMMSYAEIPALRSCSFGLPQILGINHKDAGFATVEEMVRTMMQGEREQVLAMCVLIETWGLTSSLRDRDFTVSQSWQTFTRRYNGPGQVEVYSRKLAKAYLKHRDGPPMDIPPPVDARLSRGTKGEAVRAMQADLKQLGFDPGPVDGRFGAVTAAALTDFQRSVGAEPTGIADVATLAQLDRLAGAMDTDPATDVPEKEHQAPATQPTPIPSRPPTETRGFAGAKWLWIIGGAAVVAIAIYVFFFRH